MSPPSSAPAESHKSIVRNTVWSQFRNVALPDSRFHHDYSSFIADFVGSSKATDLMTSLPAYKNASTIFIAPDNCIQELRYCALRDVKTVLDRWEMASILDSMERIGRHITLEGIKDLPNKIGLMITGTGSINHKGLRFGKGHGFFDLELAMLYSIGVVDLNTQTAAVVQECQVLDEELVGEEWDTRCDFVVTNERVIEAEGSSKPSCGILWDKLEPETLDDIEPLRELQHMMHSKE